MLSGDPAALVKHKENNDNERIIKIWFLRWFNPHKNLLRKFFSQFLKNIVFDISFILLRSWDFFHSWRYPNIQSHIVRNKFFLCVLKGTVGVIKLVYFSEMQLYKWRSLLEITIKIEYLFFFKFPEIVVCKGCRWEIVCISTLQGTETLYI